MVVNNSNNLKAFFDDLQQRKVISNYANLENFCQLQPHQKVVYLGMDCTANSLHIGHLFQLIQTIRFAKERFQIILLLGGATSKIGDPSDKLNERPLLQTEKIQEYQIKIKAQLEKIMIKPRTNITVDFAPLELFYTDKPKLLNVIYQILKIDKEESNTRKWEKYCQYIWPLVENKYTIVNNNDWLSQTNCVDFLNEVGRNISVNYLLAKDWIKQRLSTGLSYLAFSYSLFQAYDFYYLYKKYNCHGQLGGTDQWGNLTTGLKLIRGFVPENKTFAFNFPLLTDKGGKKFSKSDDGKKILWLNSNYNDFYDFFRNMSDEQAYQYITQFTFLTDQQIKELVKINNPPKLRILQRIMLELMWFLNYGEITAFKTFMLQQ